MINLIVWCCVLCVQINKVVPAQPYYYGDDGDVMVVEGDNVYSSAIGNLMSDGNISKIHIYVANTFYADDDLQLNGIKELQIFTRVWNNTQHVTFDLSGLDGANQEAAINGLAGKYGNDGTDGGNFFALARETVNGDYLTVKSNGGNGGNGQDGGTSPDIFVLLNVDDDTPSGWFSHGGDLHDYYKRYFADRGYDSEISGIDAYTSLYAVFVHDKKESFNIRLHPRKCCGTTGIGGVGGFGGRRGTLIFKSIGTNNKLESTPKLLANDGLAGESGKDGKTCESLALDVHVAAELKRAVFIVLPLHYSLSSRFTVLIHTQSMKCQPVYASSNETTVPSVPIEPNSVVTNSSGIVRYKIFLLENMKNSSLADTILETYLAIDENKEIAGGEIALRDLALEAIGLERNYLELKKRMNVRPLFRRLVSRIIIYSDNESEKRASNHLKKILLQQIIDLRLSSYSNLVLMNLTHLETVTGSMEYRNELIPMITNLTDVDLQNNLDQLRFIANGNYILARYHRAIEQFRLMYFPYAVLYLNDYRLPTEPLAFADLDHITVSTVNNLKTLRTNIENIKSDGKIWSLNNIDGTDPRDAFYIWKNAGFRVQIQNLFEGKKVKLLADAKQAKEQFNAIKFNTIDLVFRSPDRTVNDRLRDVLKSFNVIFKHPGQSVIRCNHNFYEMISDPMSIELFDLLSFKPFMILMSNRSLFYSKKFLEQLLSRILYLRRNGSQKKEDLARSLLSAQTHLLSSFTSTMTSSELLLLRVDMVALTL